jgi:hypothetical protein
MRTERDGMGGKKNKEKPTLAREKNERESSRKSYLRNDPNGEGVEAAGDGAGAGAALPPVDGGGGGGAPANGSGFLATGTGGSTFAPALAAGLGAGAGAGAEPVVSGAGFLAAAAAVAEDGVAGALALQYLSKICASQSIDRFTQCKDRHREGGGAGYTAMELRRGSAARASFTD